MGFEGTLDGQATAPRTAQHDLVRAAHRQSLHSSSFNRCRHRCSEAVHPLERQEECFLLALKDRKAITRCVEGFCGRCCENYTALLGTIQKHSCLEKCRANEFIAAALGVHFSSLLNECSSLQGDGFSHCKQVTRYLFSALNIRSKSRETE